MSLHAQVPPSSAPTVPVESVDPVGFGGWFLEYFTQPVATVLGSFGIIVAALITYKVGSKNRKQLEEHHTATHTLAATQALRDRFNTVTTQLADPVPAIRTAAVSAMEALADDWLERKQPREAQACINVLCDYLRTPYEPPTRNAHLRIETRRTYRTKYDYTETTYEYPHDDLDTRHAITRTIASHLQAHHDHSWSTFDYDLTGAYLHNTDFTGATFSGEMTSFRDATFTGESALFQDATFSGRYALFNHATFSCKFTSFYGAQLKAISFAGATFSGHTTMFGGVTFSGEATSFVGATFSGETTSFTASNFLGQETRFDGATFRGESAGFDGATFSSEDTAFNGAKFGGKVATFQGSTFSKNISFRRATFNSENTWFAGAAFIGELSSFEDPQTWVNVLVDWERHPHSVFGPLTPPPASLRPAHWPPTPAP